MFQQSTLHGTDTTINMKLYSFYKIYVLLFYLNWSHA